MISKPIAEGFKFAFSIKRMMPYMILNFLLLYDVFYMFGTVGSISSLTPEAIKSTASFFGIFITIIIAYLVFNPILFGTITHQAKNFPKEISIKKSFEFSISVYFKTIAVALILGIICGIAGFIPYLWPLVIGLLMCAFFYVLPAAIADNMKIKDSFKKSFAIFKEHVLQTVAVYIVVSAITALLVVASFIPLFFWLFENTFSLISQGVKDETVLVQNIAQLLLSPMIIPFLLIPAFLTAFTSVMNIGIKTRLYFNLKKK